MALGDGQVMDRVKSFLLEPTFANVEGMGPDDVARRRALAEALWAQGNSQQPVTSIFGGMNRVLQSFLGGRGMRAAESAEQGLRARDEQQQIAGLGQMADFAYPNQTTTPDPVSRPLETPTYGAGTQNEWSAGDFPGGEYVGAPGTRAPTITYNFGDNTIRNQPVSGELEAVLNAAAAAAGIDTIVINSGGQAPAGSGGARTGSTRHDHGGAADLQLVVNGRPLDFTNPNDLPIIQSFIAAARANGATGFGAGTDYMGNNTLHVGFGDEAVWGAGGATENAPDWLRTTVAGPPGTVTTPNPTGDFVRSLIENPQTRPMAQALIEQEIVWLTTPPAPPEPYTLGANETRFDGNNQPVAQGTGGFREQVIPQAEYQQRGLPNLPQGQIWVDTETGPTVRGATGPQTVLTAENAYDRVTGEADANFRNSIYDGETNAYSLMTRLDVMEQLMNDPNFYSGVMADEVAGLRRFFGSIGLADPQSAVAMENFGALANEAVLGILGGSLGAQISNTDRQFIRETVPNLTFSPAGNRTLLEIQRAIAQRNIQIAEMARDYQRRNGRIDDAFRAELSQWVEANPLFTTGIPGIGGAAPAPAAPAATGAAPPAATGGQVIYQNPAAGITIQRNTP